MERALDRSRADRDMELVSSNTAAAMRIEKFMLHLWVDFRCTSEKWLRLFLQPRRKIRDHGDSLADLPGYPCKKKFLSVWGDAIEGCADHAARAQRRLNFERA